jgi:hypothetical protein
MSFAFCIVSFVCLKYQRQRNDADERERRRCEQTRGARRLRGLRVELHDRLVRLAASERQTAFQLHQVTVDRILNKT